MTSKIVFLNLPAYGHVNPTLPVAQELVRRGDQVTYYNTEEFRPQIERAGATFRPYPPISLTSTAISVALQEGNLSQFPGLLLRATEALVPFLLDELPHEQPDLIIFDQSVLWGRIVATLLDVRASALITTFVLSATELNLTAREWLRVLRQALPAVPGLLRTRRRLARYTQFCLRTTVFKEPKLSFSNNHQFSMAKPCRADALSSPCAAG